MDIKKVQIWQSFSDFEYRHEFSDETINLGIAIQIRTLRHRKNLTRAQLGDLLGVSRKTISAWENPDSPPCAIGTLKKLAKVFDVGLQVRFVSFSQIAADTVNTKAPLCFEEDK